MKASNTLPEDWKQQIKNAYPKRQGQGWKLAFQKIEAHVKNGEKFSEILKGANSYRCYCIENEIEPQFIKMAVTFFGPGEWWNEYDEVEENVMTLDDEAGKLGIARQEGESDESLKRRIGIAQTMKAYNMQ